MSNPSLQFELTRRGADALAAQQTRLIEPLPRTISPDTRWVRNTATGYVELCNELMRPLGDTIYTEYEPTADELARLKAGFRVRAKGDVESPRRRIDMSEVSRASLAAQRAEAADIASENANDIFAGASEIEPAKPAKAAKSAETVATPTRVKVKSHDADRVPEDNQ